MANEHRTRSTIQSPPAITQPFPPNKSPQTSFCSPGTKPSSRGKCGKPRVWLGQAIAQVSLLAITGIKANVILGFSISTIYQFSRIYLKINNCQNFSHFHHTCSLSMRQHTLSLKCTGSMPFNYNSVYSKHLNRTVLNNTTVCPKCV